LEKIVFSVDSFEIIKSTDTFMILSIDVMATGLNKHGTIFEEEDIVRNIYSIANKPLNCIIEGGDFKGHASNVIEERKQLAIGLVPESNKAHMADKDGKRVLRVYGIVWKYLFPNAEEILRRRTKVDVSMEILPTLAEKVSGGFVRVIDWTFEAITLLGSYVTPAITGSSANVYKYSEERKEEFEKTMISYGVFIDEFTIPSDVTDEIKKGLSLDQGNPELIKYATELIDNKKINYSDVVSLKDKMTLLSGNETLLVGGKVGYEWFSAIIKEKEGGTQVDKLKDFLSGKYSSNLRYISNTENVVYCFDMDSLTHKEIPFTYSEKEDGEYEVVVDEENAKEVYKLDGKEEFASKEDGVELEVEDTIVYSLEKVKALKASLDAVSELVSTKEAELEKFSKEAQEVATKFSEAEPKISELEKEVSELKDKVLSFSELETELVELREFKLSKLKEEKQEKINHLYAKYAEFLTEDEVTELNKKAESIDDVKEFSKEVYAIAMPKAEAKIEALKKIRTESEKVENKDNLKFTITSLIDNKKDDDIKKSPTALERLKEI